MTERTNAALHVFAADCTFESLTRAFAAAAWEHTVAGPTGLGRTTHHYVSPWRDSHIVVGVWQPAAYCVKSRAGGWGAEHATLRDALRDLYSREGNVHERARLRPIMQAAGALPRVTDIPNAVAELALLTGPRATAALRGHALVLVESIRWALEDLS